MGLFNVKKGNNSKSTEVRVMVPVHCTFSIDILSSCQVANRSCSILLEKTVKLASRDLKNYF